MAGARQPAILVRLAAESSLDTGNRTALVNGEAHLEAYPDFRAKHWAETCVSLVLEGPELREAKTKLLARAAALGYSITDDADVHVIADGERIDPISLGDQRIAFLIPAARREIELRCRSFVSSQIDPSSDDSRELGLCIGRLQIDGSDVALDDDAAYAAGWYGLERDAPGHCQRWSHALAPLRSGIRLVVIDKAARSHCWARPRPSALMDREYSLIAVAGQSLVAACTPGR